MSFLTKLLIVGGIVLGLLGYIKVLKTTNNRLEIKLEVLQEKLEIQKQLNTITQFENNQTIIVNNAKEWIDDKIPDTVGEHTISF